MNEKLKQIAPYWAVVIRLFVAFIFIYAGYFKLNNSEMIVGMVTGLGFPAPTVFAWLLILTEFVGGILLALGLFTRFISVPLTFAMLVALIRVHIPNDGLLDAKTMYVALISLILVYHIFTGAAALSLDRLIFKKHY